jgi:hypothetical protein
MHPDKYEDGDKASPISAPDDSMHLIEPLLKISIDEIKQVVKLVSRFYEDVKSINDVVWRITSISAT